MFRVICKYGSWICNSCFLFISSQLRCIYGFLSTYNFFLDNLKIWWIKLCLYINYFLSTALLAILPDSHWSIRRSRDHTADCLYKVHINWYTGRRTSRGYTLGEHKINFINMDYRLSITITSQKVCKLRTMGLHAANCLSENKLLWIAISSSLENDHDFLWLTTTLRC